MPKFLIVIREFREHEFIREMPDEQAARDWADEVMAEEPTNLDGYDVAVRRLPTFSPPKEEYK